MLLSSPLRQEHQLYHHFGICQLPDTFYFKKKAEESKYERNRRRGGIKERLNIMARLNYTEDQVTCRSLRPYSPKSVYDLCVCAGQTDVIFMVA